MIFFMRADMHSRMCSRKTWWDTYTTYDRQDHSIDNPFDLSRALRKQHNENEQKLSPSKAGSNTEHVTKYTKEE